MTKQKTTKQKTTKQKDYRFALKKQLESITTEIANVKNLENPNVIFDPKEHLYINKHTGELYAGVSEIIKLKAKDFMAPWAALETVRYLGWEDEKRTKEVTNGKWTYQQWQNLLKEAKGSYRQKSKDAQDSGTVAHAWIEGYIKAAMNETKIPELPKEGDEFELNGKLQPISAETTAEACNAINAFLAWVKGKNIIWHASELVVASDLHRFAGTLDALATINGRLFLVDFKSSKDCYPEYWIQLAAYRLALEEMQIFPQDAIIIRLPKDGAKVEVYPMTMPYDLCRRTFVALREVKKWEAYVSNNDN